MNKIKIKTKLSRYLIQTPWISVREDTIEFNGSEEPFYIIEQPDCVSIFASDIEGKVALVDPYRYHTQSANWELPSGYIEPGEQPIEAAKRELLEETGCTAEKWQDFGWFYVKNDRSTAQMHVFVAEELTMHQPTLQAEDKIEEARFFGPAKVRDMICKGDIVDSDTLAALGLIWTHQLN